MISMLYYYRSKLPSDINFAMDLTKGLLVKLGNIPTLDEDCIFNLRLVLSELLINSCKHGNKFCDSKEVDLTLKVDNDFISILVEDEGSGVEYDFGAFNPFSNLEHGRGLKIVKELSDDLIIENSKIQVKINK